MEKELCYYCNLSTFKSIICNHTFWLSDIHFMNDSSEETLFLDSLSEVMRESYLSLSPKTKEYLEKNNFIKGFFTHIEKNYKNFVYICCFSDGINDDLSQWRGYADDGRGLCIGLKKEVIQALSNNTNTLQSISEKDKKEYVSISKVFAQKEISYSYKEEIMDELRKKITPIIQKYDKSEKQTVSLPHPDAEFTLELYKKTFNYKAFYKNKTFEAEKEYRICFFDSLHEESIGIADDALMDNMNKEYIFDNNSTISKLKYRESRGALIPYRELKFNFEYFNKALSSITIGPKNPMSKEDIQYFLISNGFKTSNIRVKKSGSTYQ